MKKLLPFLIISFFLNSLNSQERIDGSFEFQTDPTKKYSLYIPSGYDENSPHRLMIGFHPFNTNRWDAESWCDTLIAFAEINNLILACPDGGIDGQVDDPIDTAFTSVLMDSVFLWYNINPEKVYAMGFSWGGKTTYTYGLNHIWRFRGFIPIGAAINGTSEVNSVIQNAEGKPYYLVHGANDSPGTRFTPIKNALESNNALVNSLLMSGVGHTIDFPNRNQILTTAFEWVDSVNCSQLTNVAVIEDKPVEFRLFPNPVLQNQKITLFSSREFEDHVSINVVSVDGKVILRKDLNGIKKGNNDLPINVYDLEKGVYFLQILHHQKQISSLPFVLN